MDLIGKVVRVKIIKKQGEYYYSKTIDGKYDVYIESTDDYEEDELINSIEKCIVIDQKESSFIGFLLSNRKFINDINHYTPFFPSRQ